MIADNQTNYLYLSGQLPIKCKSFWNQFEAVFKKEDIKYSLLPETADIWAVDYMPIQVSENEFVQFSYSPDYLRNYPKRKDLITDVDQVCRSINIAQTKSSIILDGGNVVRTANKVIMCDKVLDENPSYNKYDLIKDLETLFQVDKLILIPTHPDDEFGHADGLLRLVDDTTLLVNDFGPEDKNFSEALNSSLKDEGFDLIPMPYNVYQNKGMMDASGCYINYLQMKDYIFLPVFGMDTDQVAIDLCVAVFPTYKIVPVKSKEVAKRGGVLNCISWNIAD